MKIEEKIIRDVCIVGDGAHASIKRVEYGIPYLTSKNFNKTGINLIQVEYISENDYQKHFRENSKALTKPQEGDLIFSIIGSIGGAYLFNSNDLFGLSSSVAIIRPNFKYVIPSYLLYYFKSSYLQKWVENIKSGSAQGFLSLEMIKRLPLLLPSLYIQQKIASILSSYDNLIENNKQRIKLLEEMAEEIYKEWFVRLRFPGYETAKIVDGLPEGWEKKQIDTFVKIISGYAFKTQSFDSDGIYKLVTIKNVQDGFFVTQTTDFIDELPKNLKEDCKLKDKDIILSLTGNIGRICMVYGDNYVLNQRVAKLKPTQVNYFEYVYLMFRSNFLRTTLENLSNGAAQQNLSPIEMGKLEFTFPSEKVMSKFSELTNSFFDEIIILNKKNQLLQETRDLLLPRLISGKLSVEHLVDAELGMVAEEKAIYKNKNHN